MTAYNTWRENEIKRVGAPLQHEAEAICDRHDAQPRVALCDDRRGEYVSLKADVGDVMVRKGQCSMRRLYMPVAIEFDSEGQVVR